MYETSGSPPGCQLSTEAARARAGVAEAHALNLSVFVFVLRKSSSRLGVDNRRLGVVFPGIPRPGVANPVEYPWRRSGRHPHLIPDRYGENFQATRGPGLGNSRPRKLQYIFRILSRAVLAAAGIAGCHRSPPRKVNAPAVAADSVRRGVCAHCNFAWTFIRRPPLTLVVLRRRPWSYSKPLISHNEMTLVVLVVLSYFCEERQAAIDAAAPGRRNPLTALHTSAFYQTP